MENEDLIIIPTHNRHSYLKRVISYYAKFPFTVYICDSSKIPYEMDSNDNIKYYRLSGYSFYEKILFVLTNTNVRFYTLAPDDDFFERSTLLECYTELKTNNEYVLGVGKQLFFYENFDGFFYDSDAVNTLQGIKLNYSRIRNAWNLFWNYQTILWSVYERNTLMSAFTQLNNSQFNNQNFIELVLGVNSIIHGKVFVSDNYLLYREFSNKEHWGQQHDSITILNLLKTRSLRKDVCTFLKSYKRGALFIASFSLFSYLLDGLVKLLHLRWTKIADKVVKSNPRAIVRRIKDDEVGSYIMNKKS